MVHLDADSHFVQRVLEEEFFECESLDVNKVVRREKDFIGGGSKVVFMRTGTLEERIHRLARFLEIEYLLVNFLQASPADKKIPRLQHDRLHPAVRRSVTERSPDVANGRVVLSGEEGKLKFDRSRFGDVALQIEYERRVCRNVG